MADLFNIAGRINSTSEEAVAAVAGQILDETQNKKQSEINEETATTLASHDSTITGLNSQNYVSVTASADTTAVTDVLPATGAVNTVYRVGKWDGTQYDATAYSEYSWSNNAYVLLDVKSYGIDEEPTAGSDNLVKSGGIASNIVFDVTAANSGATFADLNALLTDANLNTLIPVSVRKGGMSIKFVLTNDNKYVQYFLTKGEWSANEYDWEKINLEEEVERISNDIIVDNAIVMPLISTMDLRPMSDGYVHTNGEYSYIVKVKEGDELTIDFTIVSDTYIRFGFTAVFPANGVAVTGYGDLNPSFHVIKRTAPFDGYLLMECASDFTELTVSKNNDNTIGGKVYDLTEEVNSLEQIVDKKEPVTPVQRNGYYIKYSDSTLYEGPSFSVTEPIQVKKHQRVVVKEAAVNSTISVISTCDSSLNNIVAKVKSDDDHLPTIYQYTYIAEKDEYVSITYYTSYGTTILIETNIADVVEGLSEDVDIIAEPFNSKNLGVDGDSITYGNQWSKIVSDNLHFNTHHNVGVGSSTWGCRVVTFDGVDYTPQEYDDPNFAGISGEVPTDALTAQKLANNCAKVHTQKFIAEVTNGTYPAPDIFCYAFGTNDQVPTQEQVDAAMAATDYPTGDALYNMAGGMRWCLQKIRETYPACTIFIMLPIQRSWQKYSAYDKTQLVSKVNYIKEIAQDFGVQIIDMFHNCGINGCLEKGAPNYGPYLRDGLHPNDNGKKIMGNYVTKILQSFYFEQL